MATTTSDIQKRINRTTGVNRRKVNTTSRRGQSVTPIVENRTADREAKQYV